MAEVKEQDTYIMGMLRARFHKETPYTQEETKHYRELYSLLTAAGKRFFWENICLQTKSPNIPESIWDQTEVGEYLDYWQDWFVEIPGKHLHAVVALAIANSSWGGKGKEAALQFLNHSEPRYLDCIDLIVKNYPERTLTLWLAAAWESHCNNVLLFKECMRIIYQHTGVVYPVWNLYRGVRDVVIVEDTVRSLVEYGLELSKTVTPALVDNRRMLTDLPPRCVVFRKDGRIYTEGIPQMWFDLLNSDDGAWLVKFLRRSANEYLAQDTELSPLVFNPNLVKAAGVLLATEEYSALAELFAYVGEQHGVKILLDAGATIEHFNELLSFITSTNGRFRRDFLSPELLRHLPVRWVLTEVRDSYIPLSSLDSLMVVEGLTLEQQYNLLSLLAEATEQLRATAFGQLLELVRST